MNHYFRALRASIMLGFVLLTGCAVFPQQQVSPVQLPVASPATQKPSAYANVQVFRGKPGAKTIELSPSLPGMDKNIEMIRSNISSSGLFRSISFDSSAQSNADLSLNVRVYNHGEISAGTMMGAILTGLSLYVIPSAATDTYTVQVDVNDQDGQALAKVSNEDSMRMWQGLIFLPMAGNTIQKGFENTVGNQVRAALKEAYDSGKMNTAYTQTAPAVAGN